MRLPWNRKYMEISFHVIVTALVLVGMAALLFRLPDAKNVISETGVFPRRFCACFLGVFLFSSAGTDDEFLAVFL